MSDPSIYDDLGVRTVINGVGFRTQISGSLLRDGVAEAMNKASESYVHITDLQARMSEYISEVTGAESGFVTTGTAAGLVLGTAACIAGNDYMKMKAVPDTSDIPSKVIIPKGHYNKYARMFRAAGADLEEVGTVTYHPVNGGSDIVHDWEIDGAIDDETVAIVYTQKDHNILQLETVVEIAHSNDIPVIVDAADELPPKANLRKFIDIGADLVSFSGGKAVRGPQSSGFIAGRKELVQSAAVQQLSDGYHSDLWCPPKNLINSDDFPGRPPNGLGRSMKAGKEEIVGLKVALEGFLNQDHQKTISEWKARSERILRQLNTHSSINANKDGLKVIAKLDETADYDAVELIDMLRSESPRIWVGENRTHLNEFSISPQGLDNEEAEYLVNRIIKKL